MSSSRIFSRLLTAAVTNTASKPSLLIRTLSTTAATKTLPRSSLLNSLTRFRAISALSLPSPASPTLPSSLRTFSTRQAYNDNQGNRPPKETILLDGCDFEHWLVVVQKPPEEWTREEIIDHYIKTLAKVVGSEDEARMKIYSVSTRHYFAFGALVSEELSYKLKELEGVRWVLPDSYLDVKNKDYGGEPFVNGVAAPYDPKYHEEWVRNNQKAQERNRRNDRPRNSDRSRNFDRRQPQPQRPQGFQNNPALPAGGNMGGAPNQPGGAPGNPGYGQNVPPVNSGYGQSSPPNNAGYGQNTAPNNTGYGQNPPSSNTGYEQNPGYARNTPPSNMGGGAPNYGGHGSPGTPPVYGGQGNPGAPPNYGGQGNPGAPPNYGGQGNPGAPNYGGQGNRGAPNYGGQGNPGAPLNYGGQGNPRAPPSYGGQMGNQQNYVPPPPQGNVAGQPGGGFQSQNVPGRDPPNY